MKAAIAAMVMMPFLMVGAATAQTQSNQLLIRQALSALPAELRDHATVITYTAKGDDINLRWGNNVIYCMPPQAGANEFSASCFGSVVKTIRDFEAKERVEGKQQSAIEADVAAAQASRKLPVPGDGETVYVRRGPSETDAQEFWQILMPGADASNIGLPTAAGGGHPWMEGSRTSQARIVIPVKGSMDQAA
jgi:hypothetical protein